MWQRDMKWEMLLENGADRLTQHGVSTKLLFVKNADLESRIK